MNHENSSRKKIMIVEDSPIPMMELREKLSDAGYEIVAAVMSGESAVRAAIDKQPDIILMDIMLQGEMTGIEAAKTINEIIAVPIIFLTAYSDSETIERVKAVNPYGYLLKPIEDRELFVTLDLVLRRIEYERKVEASENRYRRLFYDSKDPIFIVNGKGEFIDFNTSLVELFDYKREEILSMKTVDFFADSASLIEIDKRYKDEGSLKDYEINLIKKDGSRIVCMLSGSPVRDDTGKIYGYQSVVHDISILKKVESQRKESLEQLRRTLSGVIEAMGMTLHAKDPYTAGHQRRVAELACAITNVLKLDEKIREGIRMTALIHDLGKIYVPSEILSKPGKISDIEFELVKSHPGVGFDILKHIDFPWPIAKCVYQHHERVNGSGYPEGLTGGEIITEAKIIAVADVVEAISSHRPYRAALGMEAALDEIITYSGILYDKEVVDACVEVLKKEEFRFAEIHDY